MKSRIVNLARQAVLKANYVLNNYDEVVWLVGDGRSGTTWVSNLINHNKRYRHMFEPFHPQYIRDVKSFVPHQYARPHGLSKELKNISNDIFSGRFTDSRVDSSNRSLLYNGILIKDIFANLLSYSVALQYPKIKPVLLIRNPFSVALSKQKKQRWLWMTEPLDLLNQTELYEDHLLPFEDLIRKTSANNNFILNQILIWSVINYIPLRQFKPVNLHVCFYESIYINPNQEISGILQFIRGSSNNCQVNLNKKIINHPSHVSGAESNLLAGTSPILSWKNELSPQTIDDGLKILQHFGFDSLYNDKSMPDRDALRKVHESGD